MLRERYEPKDLFEETKPNINIIGGILSGDDAVIDKPHSDPKTVTTDTWYSSQKNLKFFKDKGLGFLTGIAKNRSCSVDGKNFTQVQHLEIPESGLIVYLKSFG